MGMNIVYDCNFTHLIVCFVEIGGVSRVTEACDWWSLGALLFELLTGMVSRGTAGTMSLTESILRIACN